MLIYFEMVFNYFNCFFQILLAFRASRITRVREPTNLKMLSICLANMLFKMIFDSQKLPQYKEIKYFESVSKNDGSGIVYEDLIGTWKLNSVWRKGSEEIDNTSSSILQVLSAKLELKKNNSFDFKIKNSISFGIISIVFSGKGSLKGKRPLLPFCFENLLINVGNFTLVNK